MKAVWIGCSILCLVGIVLSGLVAMTGRSILRETRTAKTEAEEYAAETARAVCTTWNGAELKRRLDPLAHPDLVEAALAHRRPLGALESLGRFYATGIDVRADHAGPSTRVIVADSATFTHGVATLKLVVVRREGTWQVRSFEIVPTAPAGRVAGA